MVQLSISGGVSAGTNSSSFSHVSAFLDFRDPCLMLAIVLRSTFFVRLSSKNTNFWQIFYGN